MAAAVPIYADYTQKELDAQYDQASVVANVGDYVSRWRAAGQALRERHAVEEIAYGGGAKQAYDLWRPTEPGGPLHIHVHGGAWKGLSKEDVGFFAAPFLRFGTGYVALGFPLSDVASVDGMVASVVGGVTHILSHADRFGFDAGDISLSGFSSGAHLAAMALAEPAIASSGQVRGATLVSGLYDLEPVRLSARNSYLKLDEKSAERASPIRHVFAQDCRFAIFWGDGELAEFRRQSRAFASRLETDGHRVEAAEIAGVNHFDMLDRMADDHGASFASILSHHSKEKRP